MIIKLYARGATPHLHIIDGVENVFVDSRTTSRQVFGGLPRQADFIDGFEHFEHLIFDHQEDCRLIKYQKNGKEHNLLVYNHAYVCNDDGKTIEKVFLDFSSRNQSVQEKVA